jgi:hypothetical protein
MFQTGSITSVKDGRRFIPVHDLYNSLGAEMANILLGATQRHPFLVLARRLFIKFLNKIQQNTKL